MNDIRSTETARRSEAARKGVRTRRLNENIRNLGILRGMSADQAEAAGSAIEAALADSGTPLAQDSLEALGSAQRLMNHTSTWLADLTEQTMTEYGLSQEELNARVDAATEARWGAVAEALRDTTAGGTK